MLRPIIMKSGLYLILTLGLGLVPIEARGQGVTFRLAFDSANLGLNNGQGYKTYQNASGTLAWGEAYIMMGYAAMFRGTSDPAYLMSLADHAQSVLAQRDSVLGLKDYAGKSRPCWQATKYSANGKGYCWVVHTGMITYPMADLVYLVNQSSALAALPFKAGKTLGQVATQVLSDLKQSVATHDFQWKNGPKTGEGYYQGDPAASAVVPSVAGKALPLNQMNAMGRTLVLLWKITADSAYKTKAQALCTYLKNRLTLSGNAYVWTYWGTTWKQGDGEDISHAAINVDLAVLCRQHGLVFTDTDMQRFGYTLFDKVHKTSSTTADYVDGTGGGTYAQQLGRWLNLAPWEPRAWPIAANLLAGITSTTSGAILYGLANLSRHAPPVRDYRFYHVDWQDMGDYRQATAFGANILTLPPDPKKTVVLKLGYRASKTTTFEQWDGKVYNKNHRLAATSGSAFIWRYVPFVPSIYYAYTSAKEVLFQFTDSFVSGQGIQVKEVDPVKLPQILTQSLPAGLLGKPYSATLQGSGDAPLVWSLAAPLSGLTLDLKTGVLTFTPSASQVPGVTVTVSLRNDSGLATKSFTIAISGAGADAGPKDAASLDLSKADAQGPDATKADAFTADGPPMDSRPADGPRAEAGSGPADGRLDVLDQGVPGEGTSDRSAGGGDGSLSAVAEGGCGCGMQDPAVAGPRGLVLLLLLALRRRRQGLGPR